MLLHGTKPDIVPVICANGLNERFSGGLFGNGTYLGEDVEKIDQYVRFGARLHMPDLFTHRPRVFAAPKSASLL